MRMTLRKVASLVVVALALGTVTLPASASADADVGILVTAPPAHIPSAWECSTFYFQDDWFRTIGANCKTKSGSGYVDAYLFSEYRPLDGESLHVVDQYPNGLATRAYLKFGDGPWRVYRSYGGGTTRYDLGRIAAGQTVHLVVCSSAKSNAACSYHAHGTTW